MVAAAARPRSIQSVRSRTPVVRTRSQTVMETQISSRSTNFFRYAFAPTWIVGFGLGTLQLWIHPEDVVFNGVVGAATRSDQWMFLAVWLIFTASLLRDAVSLWSVTLSEDAVTLKRFGTTLQVPVSAIRGVSQPFHLRPQLATLTFTTSDGRERRVRFILPLATTGGLEHLGIREAPSVAEVRRLLEAHRIRHLHVAS